MAPRTCPHKLILVLAIIGAAGCNQEKSAAPPPGASNEAATRPPAVPVEDKPSLGGRVWEVTEIDGAPPGLPADARVPTIEFDTAAKTANGFAGCNTFNGGYRELNEAIRLGPFVTTRRACGALDAVEHKFLSAMARTQAYRIDEESLEFLGGDGAVVMRFKARKY
jgi:heat shock protein HslJ